MAFNYGEFAIIKGRVIDFFPNPQELECVTVAQPVGNEKVSVFGTQHVGKADIVLSIYLNYIYLGVFYGYFGHRQVLVQDTIACGSIFCLIMPECV